MKRDKKNVVYIAAFILLIAAGVIYRYVIKNNRTGPVLNGSETAETTVLSETMLTSQPDKMIKIYICGEVVNPGVYEVRQGTILDDVARMAGGFTENAALDQLNLVYEFTGNMTVFIPNPDNLEEGDRVIMRNSGIQNAEQVNALININDATKEQLITLPGIGESTAMSIISYRQEHRFDRIEDLMNVSGIGESKFNKVKDLICV